MRRFRIQNLLPIVLTLVATAVVTGPATPTPAAQSLNASRSITERIAAFGVNGGLCVQIGAQETDAAAELAATGRFLVQVLDADRSTVAEAQRRLQTSGHYGLISIDHLPEGGSLPYTENLVNLLFISSDESARVSADEASRVLCPRGLLAVERSKLTSDQLKAAGLTDVRAVGRDESWLIAKKPWPAEADEWSHPRHSASGNAASQDGLVAPPRRVRWVAGVQAEVRGMVTAGGRNFYAGVLARDSFNGLRLWHRDLIGESTADAFTMKNLGASNAPPVAGGDRLYLVDQSLQAFDGATGEPVLEYPEAGKPEVVLFDQGILIAVTKDAVMVFDADSAKLKWTFSASDPRFVVAGDDTIALISGQPQRGEPIETVVLGIESGDVRWRRSDFPWLPKVTRTVYHRGFVTYEVSTHNDEGPENAIHLVSATDGKVQLDYPFLPGMNHRRQARAMFVGDLMWLLHGGKDETGKKLPVDVSALNFLTGEVLVTHKAGLAHCFPPVMTRRYMISGEFDLTDLATGEVDANQITKAACGPDGGWVPANGLIYVTPKHCVCWPMLRGYAALAPKRPAGSVADMDLAEIDFTLQRGVAPPAQAAKKGPHADWPTYRHDPWRSGGTPADAPSQLKTLWTVDLGDQRPAGPIVDDWRENPFVKGPITSPVVAGNRVVIARPDMHEVVGLDAQSGAVAWRFTANGRVDTAPTIHDGLCLFGAKSGWVYCLRVDDGRMVWRRRAAPVEEQIVAYGQLESPWPVPGSVLVTDGVAYFAAGRQSLADGGILIFAAEPASGEIHWVRRLDTVPQEGFYESSGLEFDNFDLLHREGDGVAMSRWVFDRKSGDMSLKRWNAFAKLNTGGGEAMVPQGTWSYAPRQQRRISSYTPLRPLVAFRDNVLFGCLQGEPSVYRRDFTSKDYEEFDAKWMTGWAAGGLERDGKKPYRGYRLAEKASWQVDVFEKSKDAPTIDAVVLAGNRLLLAGSDGNLQVLSTTDGKPMANQALPSPLWDGMAVANGRLYYATRQGQLLCLGE